MYLAANTRLDNAYEVHQVARFSHNPKYNHASAIKIILHYLKRTRDKGIYIPPDRSFKLSCNVDSHFGVLFWFEDPENPPSVKSRTGYIIKFGMFLSYGYQDFKLKFLFLPWKQNILFYAIQCVIASTSRGNKRNLY